MDLTEDSHACMYRPHFFSFSMPFCYPFGLLRLPRMSTSSSPEVHRQEQLHPQPSTPAPTPPSIHPRLRPRTFDTRITTSFQSWLTSSTFDFSTEHKRLERFWAASNATRAIRSTWVHGPDRRTQSAGVSVQCTGTRTFNSATHAAALPSSTRLLHPTLPFIFRKSRIHPHLNSEGTHLC